MTCPRSACESEFIPTHWTQKYCSAFCREREKSLRYRRRNPDSIRASYRKWAEENPDSVRQNRRRWYVNNREHAIKYAKDYISRNWEETKCRLRQRKYKRRGLYTATDKNKLITLTEWELLKDVYDHKCAYCKEEFKELTQDHVVPISKGGTHTLENIVPACRSCNSSKGNRAVEDFIWDRLQKSPPL